MKTLHSLALLAVVTLALSAAATSHGQTLLNGSFEDPALTDGTSANNAGDDWTTPNGSDVYVETNGNGYGTTPYGNQWDFLSPAFGIAQTVSGSFTPLAIYTLSLEAADIEGVGDDYLNITISGGATASENFDVPSRAGGQSSDPLPFAAYTLTFTPTSDAAVTITLFNGIITDGVVTDGGGSNGPLALDDVQLIPEPSTWVLLLAGAGLVGLMLKRRAFRA